MSNETKHPETLVLHAGWRSDPATNAVAVPIYQTTSYQFDSAEHAANLFGLKELGNIYTRIMNPTQDAFEKRVAAVEGGVAALGLASGQAASAFSVQNLARAGDNIVSSTDLYGGTWNLFANTLKDQGIEARFVDPTDPEAFARATDDRTRAYYAETLPNPKLVAFPIAEVAAIGEKIRHPADHGQHRRPGAGPPVRPWRGGGDVFDHEIYWRARHLDRRRGDRRRQLPVGSAQGASAAAEHAGPQLPWCGVGGGREAARADRLYPPDARGPAARPRRSDVPVQCVPVPARPGEHAAAHARALQEHARGGEVPVGTQGGDAGDPSGVSHRRRRRADGEVPAARAWRAAGL